MDDAQQQSVLLCLGERADPVGPAPVVVRGGRQGRALRGGHGQQVGVEPQDLGQRALRLGQ
ncbi:hypothetical protein [Actinocorallia libanotica]|uniref:hypothetical protein n=1 Tax=Actinocorallia libanotica TaxID=46162 RepID=UPI0031D1F0EF